MKPSWRIACTVAPLLAACGGSDGLETDPLRRYTGSWSQCHEISPGRSREDGLTIAGEGDAQGSSLWLRTFVSKDCTGEVDFVSRSSISLRHRGMTTTPSGEVVDRVEIANGGNIFRHLYVIRADDTLYRGMGQISPPSAQDADGFPRLVDSVGALSRNPSPPR